MRSFCFLLTHIPSFLVVSDAKVTTKASSFSYIITLCINRFLFIHLLLN